MSHGQEYLTRQTKCRDGYNCSAGKTFTAISGNSKLDGFFALSSVGQRSSTTPTTPYPRKTLKIGMFFAITWTGCCLTDGSLTTLQTLPVTTTSNERMFSTLSRVKNYLGSSCGDKRLSDLLVLSRVSEDARDLDLLDADWTSTGKLFQSTVAGQQQQTNDCRQ